MLVVCGCNLDSSVCVCVCEQGVSVHVFSQILFIFPHVDLNKYDCVVFPTL